jgi:hypothetical protein
MVMRYHWGLGVGHSYAHGHAPGPSQVHTGESGLDEEETDIFLADINDNQDTMPVFAQDHDSDSSSSLNSVDYDRDLWEDEPSDDDEVSDDEDFYQMEYMYA